MEETSDEVEGTYVGLNRDGYTLGCIEVDWCGNGQAILDSKHTLDASSDSIRVQLWTFTTSVTVIEPSWGDIGGLDSAS